MFLLDNIALFPARSLLWIADKVQQAAQEQVLGESESLTAELADLYMLFETGQIAEPEYNAREAALLDRLEELHQEK